MTALPFVKKKMNHKKNLVVKGEKKKEVFLSNSKLTCEGYYTFFFFSGSKNKTQEKIITLLQVSVSIIQQMSSQFLFTCGINENYSQMEHIKYTCECNQRHMKNTLDSSCV